MNKINIDELALQTATDVVELSKQDYVGGEVQFKAAVQVAITLALEKATGLDKTRVVPTLNPMARWPFPDSNKLDRPQPNIRKRFECGYCHYCEASGTVIEQCKDCERKQRQQDGV